MSEVFTVPVFKINAVIDGTYYYDKDSALRAILHFNQRCRKEKILGELVNSYDGWNVVRIMTNDLNMVAFEIHRLDINAITHHVSATVKTLDTPTGLIFKEMMDKGVKVRFSPRLQVNTSTDEAVGVLKKSIVEIITIDVTPPDIEA